MAQYRWPDCPEAVKEQVEQFIRGVLETLAEGLDGAYLHGSLAMGGFNPERSDIDLLFVIREEMPVETKHCLAELLLRSSGAPRPLEVSFLRREDLDPWQYPTPFAFHYGEDGRHPVQEQLRSGAWKGWNQAPHRDPDLAAHIAITRSRGHCLWGEPIESVFHAVPREHYVASIVADFEWARERMVEAPTYFVLNSCRVLWYLREGAIGSKDEAGEWGIGCLPEPFPAVVRQALEWYRGVPGDEQFEAAALLGFAEHMGREISLLCRGADKGGSALGCAMSWSGCSQYPRSDAARARHSGKLSAAGATRWPGS
jgi:predicted nucleotidyltransferase